MDGEEERGERERILCNRRPSRPRWMVNKREEREKGGPLDVVEKSSLWIEERQEEERRMSRLSFRELIRLSEGS
jgi:hypothetical protein